MKKCLLILIVVLLMMGKGVVADIDFIGWKQVDIDESSVNSSSTTVYSVMIPAKTTTTTIDSNIGPTTIIKKGSESRPSYEIYILDNPKGKKLSESDAKDYLNNFMRGVNIMPFTIDPIVVSDNVVQYGSIGDNIVGIYILSTDQKISFIIGIYETMEIATSDIANIAMIAGSISF